MNRRYPLMPEPTGRIAVAEAIEPESGAVAAIELDTRNVEAKTPRPSKAIVRLDVPRGFEMTWHDFLKVVDAIGVQYLDAAG